MTQPSPRLSVIQGGAQEASPVGPVLEPSPASRPPPSPLPLLLLMGSVAVVFVMRFALGTSTAMAFWAAAPLLCGILLGPVWGQQSLRHFDRAATRLVTTGQGGALLRRFRRALGMRLFAAPVLVAEREGWALSEAGDPPGAQAAYRRAMDGWRGDPPLSVLLGYGHASYDVGDDVEAVSAYQRVIPQIGATPGIEARLAAARARCRERNRFHMRSV